MTTQTTATDVDVLAELASLRRELAEAKAKAEAQTAFCPRPIVDAVRSLGRNGRKYRGLIVQLPPGRDQDAATLRLSEEAITAIVSILADGDARRKPCDAGYLRLLTALESLDLAGAGEQTID